MFNIASLSKSETSHSEINQQRQLQFYDYDGANISYRKYKTNLTTPQQNKDTTLLLIHPIGIGQASWFWDRFISDWFNAKTSNNATSTIYTVNLLGCGVTTERNAEWNMTKQTQQYASPESSILPVSLPLLSWVGQCEAMIKNVICKNCSAMQIESINANNKVSPQNKWSIAKKAFWRANLYLGRTKLKNASKNTSKSNELITIVAQGGLAPVAILLAARNPSIVAQIILTSPPTFDDLTKSISESELRFNFNALCNPLLEKLAFSILESRWAVMLFSNLFLFARPCDCEWINRTIKDSGPDVRKPVQLFNAGYCSYRSYQEELNKIIQQTLILRGNEDNRSSDEYASILKNCLVKRIPGKNVLPWESSLDSSAAIKEFLNLLD
jgi:pimeloyl-ACP methyl ester carboxylesterase